MATARDWVKGRVWYEETAGPSSIADGDEIIGFVPNEQLDQHGTFSRYAEEPYYEGAAYPREWFYVDLTPGGVGTPEGLPEPGPTG